MPTVSKTPFTALAFGPQILLDALDFMARQSTCTDTSDVAVYVYLRDQDLFFIATDGRALWGYQPRDIWREVPGGLPWPATRRAVRCADFVTAIKAEAVDPVVLTVAGPSGLRVGSRDMPDVSGDDIFAASLTKILTELGGKPRARQGVVIDPKLMQNFPRDLVALYQVGKHLVAINAMHDWFYVFPNIYPPGSMNRFYDMCNFKQF